MQCLIFLPKYQRTIRPLEKRSEHSPRNAFSEVFRERTLNVKLRLKNFESRFKTFTGANPNIKIKMGIDKLIEKRK